MIATQLNIVLDTNVIVSAMIFRQSIPQVAMLHAFEHADVLSSVETRDELREVIARSKFDRYAPIQTRMNDVELILNQMIVIEAEPCHSNCRDPKDEKFLALALSGTAHCIISGDVHLLELSAFRNIPILTPLAYLRGQGLAVS